jgi:hypothetical protein
MLISTKAPWPISFHAEILKRSEGHLSHTRPLDTFRSFVVDPKPVTEFWRDGSRFISQALRMADQGEQAPMPPRPTALRFELLAKCSVRDIGYKW